MAKDNEAEPEVPAEDAGNAQEIAPPTLDDAEAQPSYANYCRVMGTPEELILDFCLSPNPHPGRQMNLKVQNRIVVSFYTAKRLLGALHMAVQRHERAFGVLETDVRKRAHMTEPAGGTN